MEAARRLDHGGDPPVAVGPVAQQVEIADAVGPPDDDVAHLAEAGVGAARPGADRGLRAADLGRLDVGRRRLQLVAHPVVEPARHVAGLAGEIEQRAVAADAQHALMVVVEPEIARGAEGDAHDRDAGRSARARSLPRADRRPTCRRSRRDSPPGRSRPACRRRPAAQRHQTIVGRRMGRQRAGVAAVLGLAHQLLLEPRLAAQFLDQGDHGVAAIAGARDVADADPVGLELLVARIAAQPHQPVARHRAADRDRAALHRGVDRGIHHDSALPLALGGVAFGDVAELVAHRGGELGLVVHQGEQAARHEDVAGRQGMGVGHRLVEDEEAVAAGHAAAPTSRCPTRLTSACSSGAG